MKANKSLNSLIIILALGSIIILSISCSSGTAVARPTDAKPAAVLNTEKPTEPPAVTNTPDPTKTPAPTKTAKPTDPPTPVPQPVEYTGSGDQILDLDLPFDIGLFHAIYNGESNFIVTGYNKNNESVNLLVNTIGSYNGIRPFNIGKSGEVTRLEVKASGEWKITIQPLAVEYIRVCKAPGLCEGYGDDVVGIAGDPDVAEVQYTGESNFIIVSYGETKYNLIVNEIGNYTGTVMLPKDTILLEVQSEGDWKIKFK